MKSYSDHLVAVLSDDLLNTSGRLFAKEFITEGVLREMLNMATSGEHKARILVNSVMDRINLEPQRFGELLNIFSEEPSTKLIVNHLHSAVSVGECTTINQCYYHIATKFMKVIS